MLYVISYGLVAGLLMPLLWATWYVRTRRLVGAPGWPTRRSVRFALAGEFVASLMLLVSAVGLLWQLRWAGWVHALAFGMLFHSLIGRLGDVEGHTRWLVSATLIGGLLSSYVLIFQYGLAM